MLCITFLLVFGLSVYKKNDTKTRIASLAISLLINLINPLIGCKLLILM
jgi:glycerol uptake facilitator-like aquaporin